MVQDLELCEYASMHELGGSKETTTMSRRSEQSERRLFRIGLCVLGLVCILQVTLNITLRLALYSKEESNEFSLGSLIENFCQTEQLQQDSSQQCSCCNNLLRALLREYKALKRQRDILNNKLSQVSSGTESSGDFSSGSDEYYEYS